MIASSLHTFAVLLPSKWLHPQGIGIRCVTSRTQLPSSKSDFVIAIGLSWSVISLQLSQPGITHALLCHDRVIDFDKSLKSQICCLLFHLHSKKFTFITYNQSPTRISDGEIHKFLHKRAQ